jgi:transcriptional regulator with XRE-family HTH domain
MLLDAGRLTALIKKRFGTQVAFAAACGVSKQYIHRIIKGELNPSLARLVQFADLLGVSTDELLKAESGHKEAA